MAETWLFLMLSPNWPPRKYIRDLSYYKQYIGLPRYHTCIIPYITLHTPGCINQFSKPGDTLLALSGRGNATFFPCLDQSCVGLLRLQQLYSIIGWKTSRMHYTCIIKMVICYKFIYCTWPDDQTYHSCNYDAGKVDECVQKLNVSVYKNSQHQRTSA